LRSTIFISEMDINKIFGAFNSDKDYWTYNTTIEGLEINYIYK